MARDEARQWEPWQHEYAHGAFYLFPTREVAEAVDELRHRYDPRSAAICGAHISLSEPLPAPLAEGQIEELRKVLAGHQPINFTYGPLMSMGERPGVVYGIRPVESFFELRRAIHATSAFEGHATPRADRLPHMTVAEFISLERTHELLDELRDAPTGTFPCNEVVLAAPDAAFHFRPVLTISLGGHQELETQSLA